MSEQNPTPGARVKELLEKCIQDGTSVKASNRGKLIAIGDHLEALIRIGYSRKDLWDHLRSSGVVDMEYKNFCYFVKRYVLSDDKHNNKSVQKHIQGISRRVRPPSLAEPNKSLRVVNGQGGGNSDEAGENGETNETIIAPYKNHEGLAKAMSKPLEDIL